MDLICPIDNMVASEVGAWAKDKHKYLSRYIQISSKARKKGYSYSVIEMV